MSYVRQPLLKPEVEQQLVEKMCPLWNEPDKETGKLLKGKEIAKKLQFGVKGTLFEKVKPEYIYYYRQKFNNTKLNADKTKNKFYGKFPIRKKPSFAEKTLSVDIFKDLPKKRYKHEPDDLGLMSPEEFVDKLNEKLPLSIDSPYVRRVRSYLILHYWSPLRSSEIYSREAKDFTITKDKITIHLLRKKKKTHKKKDESIDIPRGFSLVNEVVSYLRGEEWRKPLRDKRGNIITDKNGEVVYNQRPWKISCTTALSYVKEVFGEEYYPHYWRFRYITDGANDPETTLAELKAKTRLTLSALNEYVMAPKVLEKRFDRRKLRRLKEQGVIK